MFLRLAGKAQSVGGTRVGERTLADFCEAARVRAPWLARVRTLASGRGARRRLAPCTG
jgi:hypothetical protein